MIAVVEDYIYKKTGNKVTIDKTIINDPQQLLKLAYVYSIAKNGINNY